MADICYYVLTNGVLASLLGICVFFAIRHFPALRRPAVRHLLWVIVLLRLLAPPFVPFDVSPVGEWAISSLQRQSEKQERRIEYTVKSTYQLLRSVAVASQADQLLPLPVVLPESGVVAVAKLSPSNAVLQVGLRNARVVRVNLDWLAKRLLFPIWGLGAAACLILQAYIAWQFSRSIRRDGYASRIWQRRAERVAERMGFSSCPKLLLVRDKISPMLWGFGSGARILLPEKLLQGLSVRAQDTLIAHELAHYQRGDQWVRLLELAAMIVFWWNPVFWFAQREIERAEENCCDAWAVRQANGCPRTYADALLATVDFLSSGFVPPAASPAGKGDFIRERLHAIMRNRIVGGKALLPNSYPGVIVLAMLAILPTPFFSSGFGSSNAATTSGSPGVLVEEYDQPKSSGLLDEHRPQERYETDVASKDKRLSDGLSSSPAAGAVRLEIDEINYAVFRNLETNCVRDLGIGHVASADFASDSRHLAVGKNDGTVEIIECHSGETLQQIRIANSKIDSLSFSPDSKSLAVGTRNGQFRLLALPEDLGEPISRATVIARRFPGQRVRSLRFARNGKSVAIVWQRKTRNRLEILDLAGAVSKSSDWIETEFEAVFDNVASKTSPPLWRVATTDGSVLGFDEVALSDDFRQLPNIRLTAEQLREFRIQSEPNSTLE